MAVQYEDLMQSLDRIEDLTPSGSGDNISLRSVSILPAEKSSDGRVVRYPIKIGPQFCVAHRYSEFLYLRDQLIRLHPWALIPQLPEKGGIKDGILSYVAEIDESFYEYRRYGLEQFLLYLNSHSILGQDEEFHRFLTENEAEYARAVFLESKQTSKGWVETAYSFGASVKQKIQTYFYPTHYETDTQNDSHIHMRQQQLMALQAELDSLYSNVLNSSAQALEISTLHTSIGLNFEVLGTYDEGNSQFGVAVDGNGDSAQIQAACANDLQSLAEMEISTLRRTVTGALELIDRRISLLSAIAHGKQEIFNAHSRSLMERIQEMEQSAEQGITQIIEELDRLFNHLARSQKYLISLYVQKQKEFAEASCNIWRGKGSLMDY